MSKPSFPRSLPTPRQPSDLEESLATQIKWAHLPNPVRQYKAIEGRKFAFDFAWPERKLLVEVDGGEWSGGRHARGSGMQTDSEKYSLAAINGWRVLRFTGTQVEDGRALGWLEVALKWPEAK